MTITPGNTRLMEIEDAWAVVTRSVVSEAELLCPAVRKLLEEFAC